MKKQSGLPVTTFHLDIPESVAGSLRLPIPEIETRLRTELAIALYAQGVLSFGKASELAAVCRYIFADLIGDRNIPVIIPVTIWRKTWIMLAVSDAIPLQL